MDISSGEQLSSGFDKCLDKIVILLPPYARLAEAEIKLIIEQVLVICAAVYDYRESSVGMNSSAEGRKSQLCSRYENAAYALEERR